MTNKNKLLSDLLDDECSSEDLDSLLRDTDNLNSWYRYNTVSSLLKNEYSNQASIDFCQQVSAQIAEEPAIIAAPAPIKKQANKAKQSNNVQGNVFSIKGFSGGFAIAASVAVATFFSIQTIQSPVEVNSFNQQAMEQSQSVNSANDSQVAESTKVTISHNDILEQAELEVYNGLFLQEAQRTQGSGFAPVSSEYVKTIRFSADEWQQIMQKAVKKQAEKEALEKHSEQKSQ